MPSLSVSTHPGRTGPQGGGRGEESVQRRGVQTGWSLAGLDEMSQDLEDLLGVCDDGKHLHRFAASRADQRIRVVDPLDQPSPGGTALLGRHGAIGLVIVGCTDANGKVG